MRLWLVLFVALLVILFVAFLGNAMENSVCIAGQVLTAEQHTVLPVVCE